MVHTINYGFNLGIFLISSILGLSLHQHRNLWISSAKCRTHSSKGCEKIPRESFQRNWSHHFLPLFRNRRGYLREATAIILSCLVVWIKYKWILSVTSMFFVFSFFFQYFYVVTFFVCVSSLFSRVVQYVIRFVVTSKPSNAMEKKLVKKA